MSAQQVPGLRDYRGARQRRRAFATSTYGADPTRARLIPELARVLAVANADRAAVVWVDDYGAELAHPYAVLDIGHDRPERSFRLDTLVEAVDVGTPGLVDIPGQNARRWPSGPSVTIVLGCDIVRTWFVVADGRTPRPRLSSDERDELLHIAGRCSAVVLHSDLDERSAIRGMSSEKRAPRFTGWGILKDMGDGSVPKKEERLICNRFIAARLVGLVVDDGVVFSPRVPDQVARAREEIGRSFRIHPERAAWESVLHALNEGDAPGLGEATLALGRQAAAAGHWWGSAQLCSWAFEIAGASGSGTTAVTAASAMATACRRVSDRKAAAWWTRVARSVKLALRP